MKKDEDEEGGTRKHSLYAESNSRDKISSSNGIKSNWYSLKVISFQTPSSSKTLSQIMVRLGTKKTVYSFFCPSLNSFRQKCSVYSTILVDVL